MDKTKSKFTTIELILMIAKAFAPLIAIVVVERMKGPGFIGNGPRNLLVRNDYDYRARSIQFVEPTEGNELHR